MASAIPDLWKSNDDAERMYSLYLATLMKHDQNQQIVEACSVIRRYAARGPGTSAALFSYWIERYALCELKQYDLAWRQLLRAEEIETGERIDWRRRQWSPKDYRKLIYDYAPLLYFRGRYRAGCELLELGLGFMLNWPELKSIYILHNVYNNDRSPSIPARVTLTHFYRRLGKNLDEWPKWERFLNGFDERIFSIIGVSREELISNPRRLKRFFDNLIKAKEERGVGFNEEDLVESLKKVRKRQKARLRESNERTKQNAERVKQLRIRMREVFPDLPES